MATSASSHLDFDTIVHPPSLMDWGFNANKVSNAEVARGFVNVEHLETMAAHDHVILTGPRGSGKTTLLKMMTREALDEWGHRYARTLIERDEIAFYIGSDLVNRSQLESASRNSDVSNTTALAHVTDIKLSYEVLGTILKSVLYEISRDRLRLDSEQMPAAIERLATQWSVSPTVNHHESLIDAVDDAILECSRAIHRATFGDMSDLEETASQRRLASMADLLPATQRCLTAAFVGMPSRWTFLFDDIEYVPAQSQRTILELLRQLPVSFGVKVALTPLSYTRSYLDELTPTSGIYMGHDFRPISLGHQESKEIVRFTTELHTAYISRYMEQHESLSREALGEIFGVAPWEHSALSLDESIERDSVLIEQLSAHQPKFALWAKQQKISTPAEIAGLTSSQRASRIRQSRQIMMLWNEYLRRDRTIDDRFRNRTRSRRQYAKRSVYTGYPVFQLLGDGNPRISTLMIDTLLKLYARDFERSSPPESLKFTVEQQSEAAWRALSVQENLTNAVLSRHAEAYRGKSPLVLFWEICDYLRERVYFGDTFLRNPPTQIRVDVPLPEDLSDSFVDMVYTGFLVDLTPQEDLTPGSILRPGGDLVGRVFRPSYLVSADEWLPVRRGGKDVMLSSILERGRESTQGVMF